MWFKKKDRDNDNDRIEKLEKSLQQTKEDFHKRINETNKEVDKLERIIKYSKDKPTFRLVNSTGINSYYGYLYYKHILYIYINKEEYTVELEELYGTQNIDKSSGDLKVENNMAYFTILSEPFTKDGTDYRIIYKFTIEYKTGKYVCEQETFKVEEE